MKRSSLSLVRRLARACVVLFWRHEQRGWNFFTHQSTLASNTMVLIPEMRAIQSLQSRELCSHCVSTLVPLACRRQRERAMNLEVPRHPSSVCKTAMATSEAGYT
jgi:hypothetical protein